MEASAPTAPMVPLPMDVFGGGGGGGYLGSSPCQLNDRVKSLVIIRLCSGWLELNKAEIAE